MAKPLIIFGIGSVAQMAHYYATREMGLSVLGFVVDESRKTTNEFCGLPVSAWEECIKLYPPDTVAMYVAVGYREMPLRQAVFERVQSLGYTLQTIVSKSAFVAETIYGGINNFIMPGAVIEPGVHMGSNNLIWSNVTICHDSKIGNHNFFASNSTIGGEVTIGDRCFFGFSSTVAHQRHVGNDVLLAAQSLLLTNGDSLSRYHGIPATKAFDLNDQVGVCVK
jgi:sugar O-acyltransferase (sialic acid O-acetyltransferase NeuD family)